MRSSTRVALVAVGAVVAVGVAAPLALRGSSEPILVGTSLHREGDESHADAFSRRTANWGAEPEIVRYFYPGLPRGPWPAFGSAETLVSFKVPDVSRVPGGQYDTELVDYLDQIPDDGTPKRIAFFHEPEDDIAAGRLTAQEFRAALEHVDLLVDEHAPHVEVGVILMGWTANPAAGRSANDYLPDDVLDFIGWDIYPAPDEESTAELYGYAADASRELGFPEWLVAETAPVESSTQRERAAWIPVALDIARDQGFSAVLYFDSTVGGDFRLTTQQTWDAMGAEIQK